MTDTYRIPAPVATTPDGGSVTVVADTNPEAQYDPNTGTTQIALDDGALNISFGPPPSERRDASGDFEENLAELLSDSELSMIGEKLLEGIEQDKQSRDAWLQNMSDGLSLLGLEIKQPRGASVAGSTPAEGVSTIDHPLLLEAVLRFQANAYGELLPADGPVKIRNDGEGNTLAARLADALEKDLNHYLTKVAKEYYPDTDRMLLMLGFSGISFKKGYHDPIKRRPVIASIDAKDLIVSNAATDLDGAGRVTHRIMMRPSTMRRMQLLGAYRDVALGTPGYVPVRNPVDTKIEEIQGIAAPTYVDAAADQERELYECYCEIEVPGFEHELDGEPTGLPLPYKVTIDVESRKVLEIRRNWHEDDEFCLPRNRIIAYVFVPGLGFYGIGLLNILGNATKAVTAAWRLLIDAGMFSNFPGFLYVKSLAKQLTNQFRVAPGSGQPVDTMGQDIRAAIMPLPYKDPSAVFIQLIENVATAAQRVGGTAELQVGEGKQDAPVGTTLAMIEQATKLMSAVHKRLHQAQGQEFDMLRSLLMEDPEALWRHNKKSKVLQMLAAEAGQQELLNAQDGAELRHRQMFLAAISDLSLVPAADPNTSSQTERYLKVVALKQLQQTNPNIDQDTVDKRAMQVMGIEDVNSYFKPPMPPGSVPPSPEAIMAESTAMAAKARMLEAQTKARTTDQQMALKAQDLQVRQKIAEMGVAKEMIQHQQGLAQKAQEGQASRQDKRADRLHDLVKAQLSNRHSLGVAQLQQAFDVNKEGRKARMDREAKGLELQSSAQMKGLELGHAARTRGVELQHEAEQKALDREAQARQAEIAAKQKAQALKKRPVTAKPKAKK